MLLSRCILGDTVVFSISLLHRNDSPICLNFKKPVHPYLIINKRFIMNEPHYFAVSNILGEN